MDKPLDLSSMSVTEARRLMPKTTSTLSDKQVQQVVLNLDILADSIIEAVLFDDKLRANIEYNRGDKIG